MTSATFAANWERITTTERASSQSHFLDLCELLEVDKPTDVDLMAPSTPSSALSTGTSGR